jgi:uncharacterized membrane protein YphA (DoxX/SURF4 family)
MSKECAADSATSAGFCMMRVMLGVVLAAQAIEKLTQLRELQGELILTGLPHPEWMAGLLLVLEFSAALMLLMGRHLRVAGLATFCDALIAIALIALQHRALELHVRLEVSALMAATAFFVATARRGRVADESELWQHPGAPAQGATEIYETPEGTVYGASAINDSRRSQRRWIPRSAS